MNRRTLVAALLGVVVVVVLAFVFSSSRTDDKGRGARGAESPAGEASEPAASGVAPKESPAWDAGPIGSTIADRRARDELRRKILMAWAQGDGETAEAAREGRVPTRAVDGKPLDPTYIREVFREDLAPMAQHCYEELRTRHDAAAGRVTLKFKIVGDEKLGGLVEEADVETDDDGGLGDDGFTTCIRESTMSLAFKPPPEGGYVTVTYPISFTSGDEPPPR